MNNSQNIFRQNKVEPDKTKDQFFLEDQGLLRKIVELAELDRNDVVLEVGTGTGNLTRLLAREAGRVIAFEIDERYRPALSSLPANVELYFENAWEYIQLHGKYYHKKEYNKIVSNLPYSLVEPFLHNLTFLEYDKAILLIPLKMVEKIKTSGVFGSFFIPEVKFIVEKEKFHPVPKTNSAVVEIIKIPKPLETKNLGMFLRQFMYQHEEQKVKNSLVEGIIEYAKKVEKKTVTKNQARRLILRKDLGDGYLESTPGTSEVYLEVGRKFTQADFPDIYSI